MMHDELGAMPTEQRIEHYRGAISALRTDHVVFGEHSHPRDYVVHFGAVAVLAMDEADRVLVIQQYRHPLAARLWEIPAGLLDKPDEDPLAAAQRELAEEAGMLATDWKLLLDYATTPGGSTELLRVYIARGLTVLPERIWTQEAEEQDLPQALVPLDEICAAVLAGTICNTSIVAGSLAAMASRSQGWESLRPADSPWPMRQHLIATDRVFRG